MPAPNELLQEGRYRIQTSSHSGDEKVFEAHDTVRNTNVVVREIPVKLNKVTTVSQRESLKLAFANNAKALTEIEHESLPHVHDYFSEIDRQYLVTEAVEGESLTELIARNGKAFSVAEVTMWADELLDALNYLHSRKPAIIHRNIEPSNLKLHPSGKIKLVGVSIDIGVAPELAVSGRADSDNLRYSPMEQIWPGLDPASQHAITNHYDDRSERILKQPLDERSDIYSLGATLYYLITGLEPVDPLERTIEILEGKLDPLREPTQVDSQIPQEISDVLMKALEVKRENRFDAAVIMRQVLKTAIIRVAEREEGGVHEQPESEIMATGSTADPAVALAEQQLREAEVEQQRQKELMAQQLREAEEQRLRAERAAVEAAKVEMLRAAKEESEKAAEVAAKPVRLENDFLDIPVPEVVAYRDTAEVDEDELEAVLSQLEDVESGVRAATAPEQFGATDEFESEEVTVYDAPVDLAPQPSVSANVDMDVEGIFSVPESSSSRLPIPAIAGAVGLVIVIAIGGWVAMSGSGETKKLEPAPPPVQVAAPSSSEPNPETDAIASTQSTDDAAQTVEGETEQQTTVASKTKARPKKSEPAKAEAAKKKVTVDDLINDN